MVRECVLVGALNMARWDLVRLQDRRRGTRNCVGDIDVVDFLTRSRSLNTRRRIVPVVCGEDSRKYKTSAHSEGRLWFERQGGDVEQ